MQKAKDLPEMNDAIRGKDVYTLLFKSKTYGPRDYITVDRNNDTMAVGDAVGSNVKMADLDDTVSVRKSDLKSEFDRLSQSKNMKVINDNASYGPKSSEEDITSFNKGVKQSYNQILAEKYAKEPNNMPEEPSSNEQSTKHQEPISNSTVAKSPVGKDGVKKDKSLQQGKNGIVPEKKRDKNGLSLVQRHFIDEGNKILKEHGLSEYQIGYNGKTMRENMAIKKGEDLGKPEKKLTKGQIRTLHVANTKYRTGGRPDYMVLGNGLSAKVNKQIKQEQANTPAGNTVMKSNQRGVKASAPAKKVEPQTSRTKLNINQKREQSKSRGPKM